MKQFPKKPSKEEMTKIGIRARLALKRQKIEPNAPISGKLNRTDIRAAEELAHSILSDTEHGICAKLAKNMIDIAVSIDNVWAELFPVFEMIDIKIKEEKCTLIVGTWGYMLKSPKNDILSSGETLREWLTDHVYRFGDQITFPYDPDSE